VIEPLLTTVEVRCDIDHAFHVWTERTALWWPKTHTMSRDEHLDVVFEPCIGGRIFERTSDGRELDWGEILVWDPPARLRYLWFLGGDRTVATDVEVRFAANGAGTTAVEIEQTGWERLGDIGRERRDRNRSGWAGVLPRFVEAANS
jgi:uncharacterized protein YndB with AHSA1/START domain